MRRGTSPLMPLQPPVLRPCPSGWPRGSTHRAHTVGPSLLGAASLKQPKLLKERAASGEKE